MIKDELYLLIRKKLKGCLRIENEHYGIIRIYDDWEVNPLDTDIDVLYNKIVKTINIEKLNDVIIMTHKYEDEKFQEIEIILMFENYVMLNIRELGYNIYINM